MCPDYTVLLNECEKIALMRGYMLHGTSLSIKNCEMFHRANFVDCQQTVLVGMCTLKKNLGREL